MKGWPTVSVLLLSLFLAGSISCNPFGGDDEKSTRQLVKVVRGDLAITVSGSGNIEVPIEIELNFGTAGKVNKVYVEEGDAVSQGDKLAMLETDTLELALSQAQVNLTKSEVDVSRAEVAVTQAAVAVTEAEINLKNTEFTLEQTEKTDTLSDIKAAQADVDAARRDLEEALWTLYKYESGIPGWEEHQKIVNQTQLRLNTAEDTLDAMLSGSDTEEVAIKRRQVEAAQQSLELSEQSLKLTRQSLYLAQQSLNPTRLALEQARKQLNEATITAPFDGMVASVSVDEGDTIIITTTTSTIIHLIDPSTMELKVQVDEIDITEVKLDQKAIIKLDALPAFPIEGRIDSISLLPTVISGVVVYDVKVTFDVPEGMGLRTGMSSDVEIIIAERNDVLLVPSRAINFDEEGNPVVEVSVNEQIEERRVVIGIDDGFQTEIVSGLKEGEMVMQKRGGSR